MNKIPTAEELKSKMIQAVQYQSVFGIAEEKNNRIAENCVSLAIEFAKLHVEAALKRASENSNLLLTDKKGNTKTTGGYDAYGSVAAVNKQSILNAYPLEQIK